MLAVVALAVPLAINLSARVKAEVRTQAQAQADLVAATAGDLLTPSRRRELSLVAKRAAVSVRGRVLIVDSAGGVLVDSAGPSQIGASYESRPEIEAALAGRQVQIQRASKTLGKQILATAVPIIRNGRPAGAVRVTQSIASVSAAVHRAELGIVLIGLVVLALGLSGGAVIASQVARPLARLEQVARRLAQGDLTARAEVQGSREQRSLSESFNEMTGRIERLLGAQREFVADASHQLRTPLTGLRLRLEEANSLSSGAVAREIEAAIAEVDRLALTVDELLVLSRAGERRLSGSPLQLQDLAQSAVHRWQGAARERRVTIEHRHEGADARVWAARPDVERALDALIDNSLKYSPSATSITVLSAPGRLEVRDRGPGLGPAEREAVFERFRRGTAGLAGPPGSGLGLAIARELARGWGGEVSIDEREGGGSVAILTLPDDPVEHSPLPSVNEPVSTLR